MRKNFLLRVTLRVFAVYALVMIVYFAALAHYNPWLLSWFSPAPSQSGLLSFKHLALNDAREKRQGAPETIPPPVAEERQETENVFRIEPEPALDAPPQMLPLVDAVEGGSPSAGDEGGLTGEAVEEQTGGALVYDQFQDEFADDDTFEGAPAFPIAGSQSPPARGDSEEARVIIEADGNLLRHEADGDVFALLSPLGSRLKTVIGNAEYFVSNTYDANLRLVSRTVWQKTEKPVAEAVRFFSYEYADGESKKARSREVRFVADKTREKTEYAFDGLPLRVVLLSEGDKPTVISETEYVYDASRRVAEKTVRSTETGDALIEKIVYEYTTKAEKPNAYTYHDGVLIKSIVYDANRAYTELRMLEKDYSVISKYENDRLISERYMFNNTEIRRKTY